MADFVGPHHRRRLARFGRTGVRSRSGPGGLGGTIGASRRSRRCVVIAHWTSSNQVAARERPEMSASSERRPPHCSMGREIDGALVVRRVGTAARRRLRPSVWRAVGEPEPQRPRDAALCAADIHRAYASRGRSVIVNAEVACALWAGQRVRADLNHGRGVDPAIGRAGEPPRERAASRSRSRASWRMTRQRRRSAKKRSKRATQGRAVRWLRSQESTRRRCGESSVSGRSGRLCRVPRDFLSTVRRVSVACPNRT